MKKVFALLLLFLHFAFLQAQRYLTLEDAVKIAVQNNLQVKQSLNNLQLSRLNYNQSIHQFMPTLNGSIGYSQDFGNVLDNYSFQSTGDRSATNSGLFTNVLLFNGLANWRNLKMRQYDLKASEYSNEDLQNDIQVNVTLFYFQVVFDQSNLKIVEDRKELVEKQLGQARKKADAGLLTQGDVFALEAQYSTENLNYISAKNQFEKDRLRLLQYLNVDPTEVYEFGFPDPSAADIAGELPALEEVYGQAMERMPGIHAQQMRIRSSEFAVKAARAQYFPRLNFSYNLNTWFSSTNREQIITYDTIMGFEIPNFEQGDMIPFFDQYSQNLFQSVGLSLSIPIYNQNQVRNNVQVSKINRDNARIALQAEKNTLRNEIQQAYLDVQAARVKHQAAKEQLASLQEYYKYAESKFDAGLIDFTTYLESLNNKTRAETDLNQAKYDYILKEKILQLYGGIPLKF